MYYYYSVLHLPLPLRDGKEKEKRYRKIEYTHESYIKGVGTQVRLEGHGCARSEKIT